MSFHEMSTDCRIFVLSNALMKVSDCVADSQLTAWFLCASIVRISLPFKDQRAANAVRKQLRDLSHKILPPLQPVFASKQYWYKILNPKKTSRQFWIDNALFIISHVICAMQIRSATQPDTFINALLSTNIRQSVNISWKLTVATTSWKKTNLEF